jgi:hypothetical protein
MVVGCSEGSDSLVVGSVVVGSLVVGSVVVGSVVVGSVVVGSVVVGSVVVGSVVVGSVVVGSVVVDSVVGSVVVVVVLPCDGGDVTAPQTAYRLVSPIIWNVSFELYTVVVAPGLVAQPKKVYPVLARVFRPKMVTVTLYTYLVLSIGTAPLVDPFP